MPHHIEAQVHRHLATEDLERTDARRATFARREVLGSLAVLGLTALIPGGGAEAATRIPPTATRKCATCEFWGGKRSLSADRAFVEASGTGTCRNPKGPVYNKKTRPDQGAPVWVRWSRLG